MDLFTLLGKIAIDMGDSERVLDSISEKARNTRNGMESLGDGIAASGKTMMKTGAAMTAGITTPIMFLGKKAIDTAASFEYAMSEVSAISGATGDDLAALRNKAEEMGETTKFSATESAEALKYMAMAGWKTSDMLDGLEGIMNLAAASGEDLGTTSDIVTDALTAFGMSASDSGHFADILATASSNANTNVSMMGETFKYVAPIAGAMRYSAEDTALAIGLMANSGIKASQAGTSLRSIITRLAKPTEQSAMAMEALGLSVTDGSGKMKSLEDILKDMRSGFAGLTEEEKASYAAMLAGQEAMSGLLAIVNASDADFNKLVSAIGSADGAAKEMADTMNDNLSGQITLLKSQMEGLAIQFITLIMPYLRQGVEWLSKVCDWIAGLDDGTKKMIITVAGVLAAAGPVLTFLGSVTTGIGTVIKVGGSLIGGVGKLVPIVSSLIGTGGKLIGGVGSLVLKLGSSLIPAIAAIPAPVWIVIAVIGALIAAGVLLYKNWDEIKEWGKKLGESITETFNKVLDFVKGNWQGIALFLANPLIGGFKLIYDNCPAFREYIDNFLSGIKESFHNTVENVKQKASDLKEGVSQKVDELKENAINKFEELKENAHAKVEELREKVVSRTEELKEQASAKVGELKEKAVARFNELKDGAIEKIENLKQNADERFNQLRESASDKINDLKEKAVARFGELRDTATERIRNLEENAIGRFESLKERAVEKINGLKESGISKFNELKDRSVDKINLLKEKGIAGFEALKSKSLEKFENLKSGVSQKLEAVKSFVSSAVEKLKSLFNFDWKLPHIKLPHFNISGSFSLDPPSIPHIGVEWYKKAMNTPMIMDKPTAFGINPSGQIMAGGEAGSEVVSGTQTLMNMITAAVSDNNYQLYELLGKLYELLNNYLPVIADKQLILDSGVLVGELAQPMNEELAKIAHMRGRRN